MKLIEDIGYVFDTVPLIPLMTSNTSPSGIVTAQNTRDNDGYGTYAPYYAFDGRRNTYWDPGRNTSTWLQYEFEDAVCVNKIFLGLTNEAVSYIFSASNDGNNFVQLKTGYSTEDNTILIPNSDYYKYYRITCETLNSTQWFGIRTLQLFGTN